MDAHCEMILDEFRENEETFRIIQSVVLEKLNAIINDRQMMVTALTSRIKTEKSLAGKLDRKGSKYRTLNDVTDIVGVRIITFYNHEVDTIAEAVSFAFDMDWENSIDKRTIYENDRFGYMSLHYICSIPKSLYDDPAHPKVNEFRFEIQIRTTLQHAWASIYHDTGYKTDIEVPSEYLRAFNRLAGLIELADQEFDHIHDQIAAYRLGAKRLIDEGRFAEVGVDGDTMRLYVEAGAFDELTSRIASINNAEVRSASFTPYLSVFRRFGIKKLSDLEEIKRLYSDKAYELAVLQMGETDIDIITSMIPVQNLLLVYLVEQHFGSAAIKWLLDELNGERAFHERRAQRIFEQIQSLSGE